jgi:hypothetical protein
MKYACFSSALSESYRWDEDPKGNQREPREKQGTDFFYFFFFPLQICISPIGRFCILDVKGQKVNGMLAVPGFVIFLTSLRTWSKRGKKRAGAGFVRRWHAHEFHLPHVTGIVIRERRASPPPTWPPNPPQEAGDLQAEKVSAHRSGRIWDGQQLLRRLVCNWNARSVMTTGPKMTGQVSVMGQSNPKYGSMSNQATCGKP